MALLPIPFDNPDTYPGHSGVDFGQSRGTVFRASGPGVVTGRGYNPRAGFTIWVRYDVGCEVGYVHMDSHDGCPLPGTRVVEGSQLGLVGNSGNSTGPHLHVEVEGYSTTAGFWEWFTPHRVVGHDTASKDPIKEKAITVKSYTTSDALSAQSGRAALPGQGFYLHTSATAPTSNASNIIGGVGPYSITAHVYAEGEPGDVVEFFLGWQDERTTPRPRQSPHYTERVVIDRDGLLRVSREFKRAVAAGYAVYLRVNAPETNRKPVRFTLVSADAYLFKVA